VAAAPAQVSLWFLFWSFLKIGSVAFGGFMALVTVVQQFFAEERRLVTHEEMLDGISLATMMPGPLAVNVVAYVGHRLRGVVGAAVSMFAVVLPSFLLILALSFVYFEYGELPAVDKAFAAFLPAVTAIIVAAVWNLGRKAIQGPIELGLAVTGAMLVFTIGGFYMTVTVIVGAGLIGWRVFGSRVQLSEGQAAPRPLSPLKLTLVAFGLAALILLFIVQPPGIDPDSGLQLAITFSGISLLLFGGGFVFIPLIQEIVVNGLGWVTQSEFAVGIALGQVTPGPILISAAFIGFNVLGVWGAVLATVAIFTPSAIAMVTAAQMLDRIKASRAVQAALKGVRAVVVGLIFVAAVVIAQTVEVHWLSAVIFGSALLALLRFNVGAIWIIPTAGVLGVALY
jgi:chromate transporter